MGNAVNYIYHMGPELLEIITWFLGSKTFLKNVFLF